MTRAAIYLRISLDPNMDGLAIERQRADCERLVEQRGWDLVETYVDQSVSASSRNVKRPAYNRMVEDYEAGLIDAIVCYDIDRLTRQPRELEDWIERSASTTRPLVLVTANGEADLTTDGGRLYARMKGIVARNEIERKGARQARAQIQRAQLGKPPKGVPPFGYDTSAQFVEHEAEAVRAIYEAFSRGVPIYRIAHALDGHNPNGYDIPRISPKRGGKWNTSSVLQILRNPRYASYSVYTPKEIRRKIDPQETPDQAQSRRMTLRNRIVRDESGELVDGKWEPIIDRATWWRVQSLLDEPSRVSNKSRSTARKWLGTGLYRCGVCGSKMTTRGRYYSCLENNCVNRSRHLIDDYVRAVVETRLSRPDLNQLIDVPAPSLDIDQRISDQYGRIMRTERDYDNGLIEASDLKRVRDAARAEIHSLEAQRAAFSQSTLQPLLATTDPVGAFSTASTDLQRRVIDTLMTVRVYPGQQGIKKFDPETVEIEWKS